MSLHERIALITGGGTGIGLGIARVLAARGVRLVLAQRHLDAVERAAQALTDTAVLAVRVDIRDPKSVEAMMQAALDRFGQLDILVNNASLTGGVAVSSLLECLPTQVDDIVDVNLKGTFYCSQAAARHMKTRGSGNIVHIASVGGLAAQEFAAVYCATKAAQISLAQSMALELAPYGIRVNCVAPGDIHTEASGDIVKHLDQSGASGRFRRMTPLGHRGSPDDIGHAVSYLVSDEASFVTGSTLLVDGGFLAY
jgi:NAD(P)-dependent dehydrogenase (short-subunit alcohol dehydrogenase family)